MQLNMYVFHEFILLNFFMCTNCENVLFLTFETYVIHKQKKMNNI